MIARFANQLYMNIFLCVYNFVGSFSVYSKITSLVRALCHYLNGKKLRKSRKKEDRQKELLNPLKFFCDMDQG